MCRWVFADEILRERTRVRARLSRAVFQHSMRRVSAGGHAWLSIYPCLEAFRMMIAEIGVAQHRPVTLTLTLSHQGRGDSCFGCVTLALALFHRGRGDLCFGCVTLALTLSHGGERGFEFWLFHRGRGDSCLAVSPSP